MMTNPEDEIREVFFSMLDTTKNWTVPEIKAAFDEAAKEVADRDQPKSYEDMISITGPIKVIKR